jgi:hypothetical protein
VEIVIYNYKDLVKKYGNNYQLSLALNKNEIWKIEKIEKAYIVM